MGGSINYAYGNGPGMPAAPPAADEWPGTTVTPGSAPAPSPSLWSRLQPYVLPDFTAGAKPGGAPYYDATDAAVHGLTFGASDWLRGLTRGWGQGTGYSPGEQDIKNARENYAATNPVTNFAANMAGGLVPGGAIAGFGQGANLLGRAGIGAATGAGMGAIQGAADNPQNMVGGAENGALAGGAVGGAIPAAGAALGAVFPPLSNAVQTLRANGVQPTPGASGGLPGVFESVVSRIPFIGGAINGARAGAKEQLAKALEKNAGDFQRETINYALDPIGENLNPQTGIGNAAVAEMQQKVSDAYHAAIPGAGGAVDAQLQKDISDAIANARLRLPKEQADQFENFVNNSVDRRVAPAQNPMSLGQALGTLSGQDLKDADTELGREAANYLSGNTSPNDRTLGNAYRDLQGSLRDWIARVSPQNAQDLQNANQAWARQLRVNDAAGRNINGEFTPQNLAAAAKLYSSTPQFAAGGALMQNLAQDAYNKNQALIDAGKAALKAPGSAGGHGVGPQVLFANMLEHALDKMSLGLAGGIGTGVGLPLYAAYSGPGRWTMNALNSVTPRPPSLAFVPGGAGYASGLLPPASQPQGQ